MLPPDNVPVLWLRDLLIADFPELAATDLGDPVVKVFQRLDRLRLVVPQRGSGPRNPGGRGSPSLAGEESFRRRGPPGPHAPPRARRWCVPG